MKDLKESIRSKDSSLLHIEMLSDNSTRGSNLSDTPHHSGLSIKVNPALELSLSLKGMEFSVQGLGGSNIPLKIKGYQSVEWLMHKERDKTPPKYTCC